MARTPRLTPRFLARRRALGIIKHSSESRAIAATIDALCTSETLPGPGDAMTILQKSIVQTPGERSFNVRHRHLYVPPG